MRMKRGGKRVAHTRRREIHEAFWFGKLKEEENFEEVVANGRILLKLILQKYYLSV
jgi:hypothetical protein